MSKILIDLIGEPYKLGKTDCWWLATEVFKRYGVDIPTYSVSKAAVKSCCSLKKASEEIEKHQSSWTEIKTPEVPCIVLMSLGVPGAYNHVGVYIGNNSFIHTTRLRGAVTIEKLSNLLYGNRKYYKYNSSDGD